VLGSSTEASIRTALPELLQDFLSALVFIAINAITGDIRLATGFGIAIAVLQLVIMLVRHKPIPPLQWLSFALVIVLGGATLWTSDSRFVRFKPSVVHFAICAAMLKRGWQLRYFPPRVTEWMSKRELVAWGYIWAAAMAIMGLINAAAALWLDVNTWGVVVSSLMFAKLGLFFVQYSSMRWLITRRARAAAPPPTAAVD
jgi:intracellular septation protein